MVEISLADRAKLYVKVAKASSTDRFRTQSAMKGSCEAASV